MIEAKCGVTNYEGKPQRPQPCFFVHGDASPQGSKKITGKPGGFARLVDVDKNLHPWRETIAQTAMAAGWIGDAMLDEAVAVGLVFVTARPAGHFNKKGALKLSAPILPATWKDIDKLMRATLDALTGVCWKNDARVSLSRLAKVYGRPSGVIVEVCTLNGADLFDVDLTTTDPRDALPWVLNFWPNAAKERVA